MKSVFTSIFAAALLLIGLPESFSQIGDNSADAVYSKARVYVSIDKPVRGQAKEDNALLISPNGSFAYIIVDNYPNKFPVGNLVLRVKKKSGTDVSSSYQLIDSNSYAINKDLTYTYIEYSFIDPGNYGFDVYDSEGTFVGTCYVTAQLESPGSSTIKTASKYEKSKMYLSLKVPENGVAERVTNLKITREGSFAYIVVDNFPDKLNSDGIKLKVYKKSNGKLGKLHEESYDINGDNYYTYIKYSFFTDGEYVLEVYDKSGTLINSITTTVIYDE